MCFVVVGTHTKCVINEFALDARVDILIFIGPRYTWGPIYGSKSL